MVSWDCITSYNVNAAWRAQDGVFGSGRSTVCQTFSPLFSTEITMTSSWLSGCEKYRWHVKSSANNWSTESTCQTPLTSDGLNYAQGRADTDWGEEREGKRPILGKSLSLWLMSRWPQVTGGRKGEMPPLQFFHASWGVNVSALTWFCCLKITILFYNTVLKYKTNSCTASEAGSAHIFFRGQESK